MCAAVLLKETLSSGSCADYTGLLNIKRTRLATAVRKPSEPWNRRMYSFRLCRAHVRWLARIGLEFRVQDSPPEASMAFRCSGHTCIWAYGYDILGTLKDLLDRGTGAASSSRIKPRTIAVVERQLPLQSLLVSGEYACIVWGEGGNFPFSVSHMP